MKSKNNRQIFHAIKDYPKKRRIRLKCYVHIITALVVISKSKSGEKALTRGRKAKKKKLQNLLGKVFRRMEKCEVM